MRRFNFILLGLTLESPSAQRTRSPFLFIAFDILNPLRTPQLGTARSWVSLSFFLRRDDGFPGQNAHLFILLQFSKNLLDHPIFEGVKRDHAHSSTFFQGSPSRFYYFPQILQFIIHPDTERLKGFGGRVNSPRMKSSWNRTVDDLS